METFKSRSRTSWGGQNGQHDFAEASRTDHILKAENGETRKSGWPDVMKALKTNDIHPWDAETRQNSQPDVTEA